MCSQARRSDQPDSISPAHGRAPRRTSPRLRGTAHGNSRTVREQMGAKYSEAGSCLLPTSRTGGHRSTPPERGRVRRESQAPRACEHLGTVRERTRQERRSFSASRFPIRCCTNIETIPKETPKHRTINGRRGNPGGGRARSKLPFRNRLRQPGGRRREAASWGRDDRKREPTRVGRKLKSRKQSPADPHRPPPARLTRPRSHEHSELVWRWRNRRHELGNLTQRRRGLDRHRQIVVETSGVPVHLRERKDFRRRVEKRRRTCVLRYQQRKRNALAFLVVAPSRLHEALGVALGP